MSYADNIEKDHVEINYFLRLGCRIESDLVWSALSGYSGVFSTPLRSNVFPGVITWTSSGSPDSTGRRYILAANFDEMVTGPSDGLDHKKVFYDHNQGVLYLNSGGAFNPTSGSVVLYFENFFFLSTVHVGFHIKPDDENYGMVQYHGVLSNIPSVSTSANQTFYGFAPSSSGSIVIGNDAGYLSGDFFEGSISNCTFELYRCVGEVRPENTQMIFRGFTRGCKYSGSNVTIDYVDAGLLLDSSLYANRLSSSAQPDIVNAVNRQFMCGFINRLSAVCTNYNATPSNSVNRAWTVGESFVQKGIAYPHINYTPNNIPSNTTTRTYLSDTTGLNNGTRIQKRLSGSVQANVYEVTGGGVGYIDHTAMSVAVTASDDIIMCPIQSIEIINRSDTSVTALAYDDYTCINAGNFTLSTLIEADYGLAPAVNPDDYIISVSAVFTLGRVSFPSTGAPLGTRNPNSHVYDSPVQAIYEVLYSAGFADNEEYYDTDSFEDAAAACDIRLGLVTPRNNNEFTPQNYRDVIAKICETALLKVYMKNGKWRVDVIAPLGTTTANVGVDDLEAGFDYEKQTEDLYKEVVVKWDYGEISLAYNLTQDSFRTKSQTNPTSQVINNNNKTLIK